MENETQLTKKGHLNLIGIALEKPTKGRNSMGCSESFHNPHYLVGRCFDMEKLESMDENELNNLIKLADYASDVFY